MKRGEKKSYIFTTFVNTKFVTTGNKGNNSFFVMLKEMYQIKFRNKNID